MNKFAASIALSAAFAGAASAESPVGGGMVGDQVSPVAAKSGSGFVVAWQDSRIDGKGWGIALQRFNSGLSSVGAIQRVNSQSFEHQERPGVAAFADGGTVVVWQSGRRGQQDVMFRQLQADGSWLRSESYANTFRVGDQVEPSVTVLRDNTFLIAWTTRGQFGATSRGVMAQRFSRNGSRLGGEFRVDDVKSADSGMPRLLANADGGFSALWTSDALTGVSRRQLQVRQFASDSAPIGASAKVAGVTGDISEFAVAPSSVGGDLLVRHSGGKTVSLYTLSGSAASNVRQFASSAQADGLSVGSDGGSVLCAWSSRRADGLGSASYSISLDRSNPTAAAPARISSAVTLGETAPSLLSLGQNNTVAIWSRMSGNNGFDVVLNAQ